MGEAEDTDLGGSVILGEPVGGLFGKLPLLEREGLWCRVIWCVDVWEMNRLVSGIYLWLGGPLIGMRGLVWGELRQVIHG